MINWPSPYLPPINLHNAPSKGRKMRMQSASEHDIVVGRGRIMGAVDPSDGKKLWALPGGRYTFDAAVAEKSAAVINEIINRL